MDKLIELEIDALKAQIKGLIEEMGYLKAFVRSNYKESHPGTVFGDEWAKKEKIAHS